MTDPGGGVKSDSDEAPEANAIDLLPGDALTLQEAGEVAREVPADVIVLAGAVDSGKTTLMVSIYESFQEAPFAEFLFAGSQTLPGFERRCHEGRIISEREEPHTQHTLPAEGIRFLHLAVVSQELPSRRTDLLMADISGELFRVARDSTDGCSQLTLLRRASRLVLFLDGEKLAQPEARFKAINDARSILRSVLESKMLGRDCVVDVLFAKWDAIATAPDSAALLQVLEDARAQLARTAGTAVRRMEFHSVAARPKAAAFPYAHGVATLFRSWCAAPAQRPRLRVAVPSVPADRAFSLFAENEYRRLRENGTLELV